MYASPRKLALEELLRDLGPQLACGAAPKSRHEGGSEVYSTLATGLDKLDTLLQGGIPKGCISEFVGNCGSGRTSLAFHVLAEALQQGPAAAWIEAGNSFSPESAAALGVDLDRLLWVCASHTKEALRSAELVLKTPGFVLVLLDLALSGERAREVRSLPRAVWLRLHRAAQRSDTPLLLVSRQRLAGSEASLAVALHAQPLRTPDVHGLLDGLEIECRVVRASGATAPQHATIELRAAMSGI